MPSSNRSTANTVSGIAGFDVRAGAGGMAGGNSGCSAEVLSGARSIQPLNIKKEQVTTIIVNNLPIIDAMIVLEEISCQLEVLANLAQGAPICDLRLHRIRKREIPVYDILPIYI
jgi:hypothetical protein